MKGFVSCYFLCVLSKSLITCHQLRPIGSYQLKAKAVSPLINPSGCQYYSLRYVASHSNVLRGSSRVPAGTRDEPLRTSAWEAIRYAASVY